MKSMTGMGKASGLLQDVPIRLEIKSVNHRYLDTNFRAPGRYSPLEIPVQQFIREHINRGRVEIFIFEEKTAQLSPTEITAFKNYHSYLSNITTELKIAEPVSLQHLLSGVGGWIYKELDVSKTWKDLKPILLKAITDLNKMREKEGLSLREDIKGRLTTIQKIKENVESLVSEVQEQLDEKLTNKIKERKEELAELDPQRLHTEVVYYLDRMDVSEELKRLESHFSQILSFIESKDPIGRKIDFLLQEFNREFNTIASKSQNAQIAHLVVDAKVALEKIREQIQNIE